MLTEVAANVWRITTPLPFRPREVHAYLVLLAEGGWMLVDGGVGTDAAWVALDEGVRAVAGDWSGVRLQVVTHLHLDHLGLAARVQRFGIPVAMHGLDADRALQAVADPHGEAAYRAWLLATAGVPEAIGRGLEELRNLNHSLAPPVVPDLRLDGGDGELSAAPEWCWCWTPGHTAGHISLWRAGDGVLIGGDLVIPRVTPTLGVNRQRADPVGDYLASLERVGELRAVRLLPGHGEVLVPPAERIAELRRAAEDETGAVEALLGSEPASTWEVVVRRYPKRDLPPAVAMLAARETLAHLDRLQASGRIQREVLPGGAAGFASLTGAG